MRKRVKKQLEKTREAEREQYRSMLERSHRLDLETAQLRKALRISDEENKKLKAMFEQLQAEYEELETSSEAARNKLVAEHDAVIEGIGAYADELNATIRSLGETIDKLKRPWWRRWWHLLKKGE